jgi:repressor LexA
MKTKRETKTGKAMRMRIVEAIATHWAEHRYAPTVRELAAAVGLRSPCPVWEHLAALRRAGAVTWREGATRTLRLTSAPEAEMLNLPLTSGRADSTIAAAIRLTGRQARTE